jgi:gamma-glutamyltranspeptidase/glutathione hydrolase
MTGEAAALLAEAVAVRGRATVTAVAPLAVNAGLAVLARGGNAFDAAVAAGLVESVAVPMRCGLGGDLVALVRQADGTLETLVSIGPGVAALDSGGRLEITGPRSIGIPGAPHGYAALAAKGRLGLAALAAPAIDAAETGVPWSRAAVQLTVEAQELLRRHNGALPFLPGGAPPQVGALLRLPGLARLLRRFADSGAALFHGEPGRVLADHVQALGGLLTRADLEAMPARWQAPARLALAGAVISATPAPTHGPGLLRALELVRDEALSPVAAARLARAEARAAGKRPQDGGTSVLTAADREGTVVVLVHSNAFVRYGSGVVLPAFDLVLANRPGRGFALDAPPQAPNAPRAGRVPPTTLHAWAIETAGRIDLGATPGGIDQMPWNLQSAMQCLANRALGEIVTAPRWGLDTDDGLTCEADHPLAGSEGKTVPALSQGSAQQIVRLVAGEATIEAAADPRTGARAAAL